MPSSGSSVQGKKRAMTPAEVMSIAASTGALLPACVPKYVTDLVIPPPMPVTTQPLSEVRGGLNTVRPGWMVHSTTHRARNG
jgi:hypothetical protein